MNAAALQLFERALDQPEARRRAFIVDESGNDEALRSAALKLLEAHAASAGFLDQPVVQRRIGAYRLLSPLGAGGMGQVWLAERHDGAYQQRVAIKVLASLVGDPEALRRAAAERQFLAWLDHPHIARVLDGGTTPEGQPYLVMEYVDGVRIDVWCRERRLDPAARVRLFLQVIDAVDAAHRALIIHRDIKPANVLVTPEGETKLLDFGIAKSLGEGLVSATRTGLAPMTPEYASPEQLGAQPLTTASDVYALGLLLYELLSGSVANPLRGTLGDFARTIAEQAPTRPSQRMDAAALAVDAEIAEDWRRRLLGDLDRVLTKALAPEPARRYASARAFGDDLQRWLEHRPVLARGGGAGYRLSKFVQRHRWAVTAASAAVIALGIGLGIAAVQGRRAANEGERAMRANQFLTKVIASADPYFGGKPPLLVDALDRAVDDIPRELAGQPLLEADIRRAIGQAYMALERNDSARVQLERAVALRAPSGGTDYAKALDTLAVLEWTTGHYDVTARLFDEGLRHCGGDARGRQQRAELLNDYSILTSTIGDYAQALAYAREARTLRDALPDTPPRERAVGLGNVAYALDGLQRFAESEQTYREALRLLDTIAPPPELDISITLNNLAFVLKEMGRSADALAAQERAIALKRKVMGPDYPRLATPLSNLAIQYAEAGRLDEAEAAVRDALRLGALAFSANDQMLGNLHVTAAKVAQARGDREAVRREAQAALTIYATAEALEPGRREKAQALLDALQTDITPTQATR